ncbi:MAG: hypothetical protein EBS35_02325 [Bacteroidetes bacterium]|nr:hypothetical protein [Bacteroidota bacterium]
MNIDENKVYFISHLAKYAKFCFLGLLFIFCRGISQNHLSTPGTLPDAGDIFHYEVEKYPGSLNLEGGINKRWDYSSLLSPVTQKVNWQSTGALLKVQVEDNTEGFFTRDKSDLVWLAGSGPDFLGHAKSSQWVFTDPLIEKKTNLKYGSGFYDEGTCYVTFSKLNADPEFLKLFTLQPDSIRIKYTIERQTILDAYGKMVLPEEIIDVLREKRTDRYIPVRVETKIGRRSWQMVNISLKSTQRLSYHFHHPDARETIVVVKMDPSENNLKAEKVSFRSIAPERNIFPMGQIKPNAYPAPNPTLGLVRFDFISLPPGNYKLIIWNQLGGEQFRKNYQIKERYFMDKIDLTYLKRGYYWYEISDAFGNKYKPQSLIIIRP